MNNKNLKNIKPYIGITGFMKRSEVKAVLDLMPSESKRLLMVGVLAMYTILAFFISTQFLPVADE